MKKTVANTTIVLQVSTIISFYQLPLINFAPTSRDQSVQKRGHYGPHPK